MYRLELCFLSLLSLVLPRKGQAEAPTQQIFEFPDNTFIENIHLRPNGHLLLSTLSSDMLLTFDPASAKPSPKAVANLTGCTGLTGMATVGLNTFAVSCGVHAKFSFDNNTMRVFVVQIPDNSDSGVVLENISVPGTEVLNGMASLPFKPYIVLSPDSIGGRIFRVNTVTREVDVAFEDPLLGYGNDTVVAVGANGLKIFNDYLYFTNSGLGFFARVKIDRDGNRSGDIEIIARLSVSATQAYDDFAFDYYGNAYVALHSYAVVKITPDGTQTIFAGGTDSSSLIKQPTSAAMSLDGKSIFVSTGGTTINGTVYGGQVIRITL